MASFEQSGQVRLVSRVIESWRVGSIQREVPVKPRWPNELGEKYFPDCDGVEGVSQPRARDVPRGAGSRRVNRATVSGRRMARPELSMAWANLARSAAVEKSPAWAATPPRMLAFSSWTSPWISLPRNLLRPGGWLPLDGVCAAGISRARVPAP